MFDTTLIASNPRREVKRKFATLPAALAIHAVALGLVMVGQLWAVDQVPAMVAVPPLSVHILPPMGGGDDHPAGQHAPRIAASHAARAALTQPQAVPPESPRNPGPEPPDDSVVPGSLTLEPGKEGQQGLGSGPGTGPGEGKGEGDSPAIGPIHIGGNVLPPIPIERSAPRYPELARKLRIQGVASLEAVIDEEGNVTKVRLTSDPGFGCGQAAVDAVQTWRYQPATLNGHAVAVYLTISVTFQLNGVG